MSGSKLAQIVERIRPKMSVRKRSPIVDAMLAEVNVDRLVGLARQMIAIPSPSGEERDLARFLAGYLNGAGLDAETHLVSVGGRDSEQVTGVLRGNGTGPSLMLNGHLDTARWDSDVYRRDLWTVDPYAGTLEDGKLYGNGAVNMKGQIASAITAAIAVMTSGIQLKGDLHIVGVAGETPGGFGAKELMDSGFRADYAVVVEPSGNQVIPGFTKVSRGRIRFEGRARHPGSHHDAVDPLGMAQRLIVAMGPQHTLLPESGWLRYGRQDVEYPGFPRYRITALHYEADFCDLTYDLRLLPSHMDAEATADLEALIRTLSSEDPSFNARVIRPPTPDFLNRPDTPELRRDAAIIRALERAHGAEYDEAVTVSPAGRLGFCDDSSYFRGAGIEAVTYGPGLEEPWPMVDEWIGVEDLKRSARVYARLILDICGFNTRRGESIER